MVHNGRIASWLCWLATVPRNQIVCGCFYISCAVKASCLPYHHVKHMLSFRVEPENETILVEQILEESLVVTGFDNYGTDPEPEIVNEGKPRFMH